MHPQSEEQFTTRSERGAVVVSVLGPLTRGSLNTEGLLGEFSKLLNIGLRRFILDLEPVSTMDTDGIHEVLKAFNLVTDRGGELTIRGAVTISLDGGLIIGSDNEPLLENEITRLLDLGLRSLVLDFEKVTKMDSGGLTTVIAACSRAANRGGKVTLVNLPRIWSRDH